MTNVGSNIAYFLTGAIYFQR